VAGWVAVVVVVVEEEGVVEERGERRRVTAVQVARSFRQKEALYPAPETLVY